jgi:hypothetical protein
MPVNNKLLIVQLCIFSLITYNHKYCMDAEKVGYNFSTTEIMKHTCKNSLISVQQN